MLLADPDDTDDTGQTGQTGQTVDEADLLGRARARDCAAVAALYERHRPAALRLAQLLAGPDGAEDLLADAFARIVARFHAGGGPTSNFHAYLFVTIRNRHRDLQRRGRHEEPVSDQPWLLDDALPGPDAPVDHLADDDAIAAFGSLPPPWQRVLRMLEVEELAITEVAERTGLAPAAVSSLAYRAREGLRTAYLDQRVRQVPATTTECAWVRERLGRFVRAAVTTGTACRVETHLARCSTCARLRAELERISREFSCGGPAHRAPSAVKAAASRGTTGPAAAAEVPVYVTR